MKKSLEKVILQNSNATDIDLAVCEWGIDLEELSFDEHSSTCVCGKKDLKYIYTIYNKENGNTLYPIGSVCIKEFEREDLLEELKNIESIIKVHNYGLEHKKLKLNSDCVNRRVISYLDSLDFFPEGNKINVRFPLRNGSISKAYPHNLEDEYENPLEIAEYLTYWFNKKSDKVEYITEYDIHAINQLLSMIQNGIPRLFQGVKYFQQNTNKITK